jgi:hypothetical protein
MVIQEKRSLLCVCIVFLFAQSSFAAPVRVHPDGAFAGRLDSSTSEALYTSSNELLQYFKTHFGVSNCASKLNRLADTLEPFEIAPRDPKEFRTFATASVDRLFQARIELREKLNQSYSPDPQWNGFTQECANSARRVYNAIRVIEDTLTHHTQRWMLEPSTRGTRKHRKGSKLGGYVWETGVNSRYEREYDRQNLLKNLQSGDVILSRGIRSVSASIARMALEDGQFSHLIFVYQPDRSKREFVTVEAHFEVGVSVFPIEELIESEGYGRLVLYRYRGDPEVAHNAAKRMYDHVMQHRAQNRGANPRYNFAVDMNREDQLFCSQVVHKGYREASTDELSIPLYRSHFIMKNPKFLRDLGVSTETTFAPADMEVEPRFEMIAEWRRTWEIRRTLLMDAVFNKIFEWMDRFNYEVIPSIDAGIARDIILPLRKNLGWFSDRLPEYMDPKALETIVTLDGVSTKMTDWLAKEEARYEKKYGRPMTWPMLHERLEDLRVWDITRLQDIWRSSGDDYGPGPTVFTWNFRPKTIYNTDWERLKTR